jgi:hypothetical protein
MLSIIEVAALDAMSSSGVRASEGSSACRVGLMSVHARPNTAAKTKTRTTASAKAAAAEAPSATEPRMSIATRNRSRRNRSPREAANGARIAAGSNRTSPATPTADVPPCS